MKRDQNSRVRKNQITNFADGLFKDQDGDYHGFPDNAMADALNLVLMRTGSIKAEKGVVPILQNVTGYSSDTEVVGFSVAVDRVVIFLYNAVESWSEIGVVTFGDAASADTAMYTPKIGSRAGSGYVARAHTVFSGFENMVDSVARINSNGDTLVYYTDGVSVPRRINLDNLPDAISIVVDGSAIPDGYWTLYGLGAEPQTSRFIVGTETERAQNAGGYTGFSTQGEEGYVFYETDTGLAFTLIEVSPGYFDWDASSANYLGDPLTDFITATASATIEDDEAFDTATRLFLQFSIPTVKVSSAERGDLPTGVYQYFIRYQTGEGNSTAPAPVTPLYPIGDGQVFDNRYNYGGAFPPQSDGDTALVLEISDLDLAYDFFEILVYTYEGVASTPALYSLSVQSVRAGTITFTHSSSSQYREQISDAIFDEDLVGYQSAEVIDQKDGRLFLSNLTRDNTEIAYPEQGFDDFFKWLAQNTEIYYNTYISQEDIDLDLSVATVDTNGVSRKVSGTGSQDFYDYLRDKNLAGINTGGGSGSVTLDTQGGSMQPNYSGGPFAPKTFMRGEVYSFAIAPVFKGGRVGFAYHIPGFGAGVLRQPGVVSSGTTRLDGYVTSILYPRNQEYPDHYITHHKMPDNAEAPFLENGVLKYLGVRFDLPPIPESVKSKVEGFVFLQQPRTESNRTILYQAWMKPTIKHDNINYPCPGYGLAKISVSSTDSFNGAGGVYYDFSDLNYEVAQLYAPDYIHGVVNAKEGQKIQHVGDLVMNVVIDSRDVNSSTTGNGELLFVDPFGNTRSLNVNSAWARSARRYTVLRTRGFIAGKIFTSDIRETVEIQPFQSNPVGIEGEEFQNNFKSFSVPTATATSYVSGGSNGCFLVVLDDITKPQKRYIDDFSKNKWEFYRSGQIRRGDRLNSLHAASNVNPLQPLVNVVQENTFIYGELQDATYNAMEFVRLGKGQNPFSGTPYSENQYGFLRGDCHLSRYFLNVADHLVFRGRSPQGEATFPVTTALIPMWMETQGNLNLRSYSQENGQPTVVPPVPNYPFLYDSVDGSDTLGQFQFDLGLGHATEYNKQYHRLSDAITYFPKTITFQNIEKFPTRVVYSEFSTNTETSDSYRLFLVNNFQDLPQDKGEIKDLFVVNRKLFARAQRGMFELFVNPQEMVRTEDSTVIALGAGGVFTRPAQEVIPVEGGYIGASSYSEVEVTPFGAVILDTVQGKVFVLANQVSEISARGMALWFRDNLLPQAHTRTTGYAVGYDPREERILISSRQAAWTVSYALGAQRWASLHTYKPQGYFTLGRQLYGIRGFKIHSLGTGTPLGMEDSGANAAEHKMIVEVVIKAGGLPFILQTLAWAGFTEAARFFRRYDVGFTGIRAYNHRYDSGSLEILYSSDHTERPTNSQVKVSYRQEEYRLSAPRSSVGDFSLPIDPSNSDNVGLNTEFKPRISGKYVLLRLTLDPSLGQTDYIVNYLRSQIEHDIV